MSTVVQMEVVPDATVPETKSVGTRIKEYIWDAGQTPEVSEYV